MGGYYVDAAHPPSPTLGDAGVGDAPTAHVNPFYERASRRLIEQGRIGGQYADSQTDRLSDEHEALIAFERERAALTDVVNVHTRGGG